MPHRLHMAQDADGLLAEVTGPLFRGDEHCHGTIDLERAVENAEGLVDPSARDVVVHVDLLALHRMGIRAGVCALRDGDLAQVLASASIHVLVFLRLKRKPLRGSQVAVRSAELTVAAY